MLKWSKQKFLLTYQKYILALYDQFYSLMAENPVSKTLGHQVKIQEKQVETQLEQYFFETCIYLELL